MCTALLVRWGIWKVLWSLWFLHFSGDWGPKYIHTWQKKRICNRQRTKQNMSPYPCNLDLDKETGQHAQKWSIKENKSPSFAKQKCVQYLSEKHTLPSSKIIWLMSILKIIAFDQEYLKFISVLSFCKICRHSIFSFLTGSGLIALNLFTDKCPTVHVGIYTCMHPLFMDFWQSLFKLLRKYS